MNGIAPAPWSCEWDRESDTVWQDAGTQGYMGNGRDTGVQRTGTAMQGVGRRDAVCGR